MINIALIFIFISWDNLDVLTHKDTCVSDSYEDVGLPDVPIPSEIDWKLREGFPGISHHMSKYHWREMKHGPFKFDESITAKEARVHVWSLANSANCVENHNQRQLFIIDNFGAALSFSNPCRALS